MTPKPRHVYQMHYKRYSTEYNIRIMARTVAEALVAAAKLWKQRHYTKDCEVLSVTRELTLDCVA